MVPGNERDSPVVFVLWGGHAQKQLRLIDTTRHAVVQAAHPSPLSARNGFFGSPSYSAVNAALRKADKPAIDWRIPDLSCALVLPCSVAWMSKQSRIEAQPISL